MKLIHLRRTLTFFFLFLLLSCGKEADQTNIVVFLCDDLGYGDLSCYGHPVIQTPHLDELVSSGIKLTDYYSAAPVCSPSRVGLLTGRSPNRVGVYDFIPGGRKSENMRHLVHLQEDETAIPNLLKSVGYATCLVGKWHCSSLFNSREQPQADYFGFDHWFATHNNAAPSHENPRNFVRNGEEVGEIEGYSCQIIVEEAMDWLGKRESEVPFYLQVCFHEPHEPVASPQSIVDKYLPYSDNEDQAQYFANVENVDLAVGRLLEYMEANVEGQTLVIFTSDNGPETLNRYARAKRSFGSTGYLKGMKLWTHEAGFRVPCIINWMGKPGFSGTSDVMVSALDLLPTFCELAGAPLPEKELDGTSIAPLLKGRDFSRTKPLLWSFYNALNDHMLAMRDGDWKIMARLKNDSMYLPKITNLYDGNEALVKSCELSDFVLYNLREDRSETKDVANLHPELFENMKKQLEEEYANLLADSHIWKRD